MSNEPNMGVDDQGVIHVPLEYIVDRLKFQISDQAVAIASLQGAKAVLQEHIKALDEELKVARNMLDDCSKK